MSVLTPFNLTIRQRILNFVCAGQRMKMFLAKNTKQSSKYEHTKKKKELEPKWIMPSLLLVHSVGSYSCDMKDQQMKDLVLCKPEE